MDNRKMGDTGGDMTKTKDRIEELVKELFYLAIVDYSQHDAMANNPTPEESARDLIEKALKQQRQEIIEDLAEDMAEARHKIKKDTRQEIVEEVKAMEPSCSLISNEKWAYDKAKDDVIKLLKEME